MIITEKYLRHLIRSTLTEGGLKMPPQYRRDLTPKLVQEAAAVYRNFMQGFNLWLEAMGEDPLQPIRPTGSSTYANRDITEKPDATYGDIDYLVSFPVVYNGSNTTEKRTDEKNSVKKYTSLLLEYLKTRSPVEVNVDLTGEVTPWMIIVRVPSGGFAQVDTVITHPPYSEWMKGRYTPERGIKGYVTGNLFKSLGDYFVLTIGTEGVLARIKDGQRVSSKFRSGITYETVSVSYKNFIKDIADYVIVGPYVPDPLLVQHPGMDADNVSIVDLAQGIVGLASTLETHESIPASQMLSKIYEDFVSNMAENVSRKINRDITPEYEEKMLKINSVQAERVKLIFGI